MGWITTGAYLKLLSSTNEESTVDPTQQLTRDAPRPPRNPPVSQTTQVCNGQVIVCPCSCVPRVCEVKVQYSIDDPDAPFIVKPLDPGCDAAGLELALAVALTQLLKGP